jgi:hypothetical protein
MPKINTVEHARVETKCSKCGDVIKAAIVGKTESGKNARVPGDSYIWIQKKNGPKVARCSKPACRFKPSDLTSSDKLSRVYSAREEAEENIVAWGGDPEEPGDVDELKTILETAAETIREVGEEYTESADNMENAFPGGSPTIDDCREKADSLESWAGELEGVDFEDFDGEGAEDDEAQTSTLGERIAAWESDQRDAAHAALSECPV